jgi:hypothetical protein
MEEIQKILETLAPFTPADVVSVGVIDFKNSHFKVVSTRSEPIYFDLASLTKVLTNSLGFFLGPKLYDEKTLLCLSHRGGLPAWGLLPNEGWKEIIRSYEIKESPTLYSDYSALRVMLNLEEKGVDLRQLCEKVWDPELIFWKELPTHVALVQCGYEHGEKNIGVVHDPNARNLNVFCSHAGLFSTIEGLCRTLVNYQDKTDFIKRVKQDLESHDHRFSCGWDRVENPEISLAGKGCGKFTFGHLGFTGTSVWIDPDKMRGHVILSNVVKEHWFDKSGLNDLRKAVGEKVWAL